MLTAPLVRAVDAAVGERTAMRIDTKMKNGTTGSGIYNHPRLSVAVGDATVGGRMRVDIDRHADSNVPDGFNPRTYSLLC